MGVDTTALDGRPFLYSTTEIVQTGGRLQSTIGQASLERVSAGESEMLTLQIAEPVNGAFQEPDGRTYRPYLTGDPLVFSASVFVSDCTAQSMPDDDSLELISADRKVTLTY
ncbi:MAG: hypothetical protein RLZZ437_2057 [Pseudomonadota bacterium]